MDKYNYNLWLHTIIFVFILGYIYNYMSTYKFIFYNYVRVHTIIFVFIKRYTYNYMSIYKIYLIYLYVQFYECLNDDVQ